MKNNKDQMYISLGLIILITFVLLTVWEFFIEGWLLNSVFNYNFSKTTIEHWKVIAVGLTAVGISLIFPFRKILTSLKELGQTQDTLKKEQDFTKAIFSADSSLCLIVDNFNKITQTNAKTLKDLGYTESDLIGKNWIRTLIPESSQETTLNNFTKFSNDKTKLLDYFHCPILKKDSDEVTVKFQTSTIYDQSGKISYSIISGQLVPSETEIPPTPISNDNNNAKIKKLNEVLKQNKKKYHKEVLKNARTKARFKFWFELEKTLISFPTHSNKNKDEINKRINATLKTFGTLTRSNQGFIFLFSKDNATMSNSHLWIEEDPGLSANPEEKIDLDTFPWFKTKLLNNEIIHIPSLNDFPPKANVEKEVLSSQGIKSLISIPLTHKGRPFGYLGFEKTSEEKQWDNEEIALLKVMSRALSKILITEKEFKDTTPKIQETSSSEFKLVKKELEAALEEKSKLESELELERSKVPQSDQENSKELETLKKELHEVQEKKANLEKKLKDTTNVDGRFSDIQFKLKTSESELQNSKNTIQELENSLEESKLSVKNLTEQINHEKSEKAKLNAKLTDHENLVNQKEEEFSSLNETQSELELEINELRKIKNSFEESQRIIEEQGNQLKEYKIQNKELQSSKELISKIKKENEELNSQIHNLQKQLGDNKEKIDQIISIENVNEKLNSEIKIKDQAIQNLNTEVKNKSQIINNLNIERENFSKHQISLERMEEEKFSLENSLKAKDEEVAKIKDELDQVRKEKEISIQKNTQMEEQLQQVQVLNANLHLKTNQLNEANDSLKLIQQENQNLAFTTQQLKQQIEDKTHIIEEKSDYIEGQKKTIEDKDRSLKSKDQNISQLKKIAGQLDQINLPVFTLNSIGQVVTWNQGAEALTGLTPEQAIGNNFSSILKGNSTIPTPDELKAIFEKCPSFHNELTFKNSLGQMIFGNIRLTAIKNSAGQLDHIIGYIHEIPSEAQNNQIKQLNEHYFSTLSKLELCYVTLSENYKILDYNPYSQTTYNWEKEHTLQKEFFETLCNSSSLSVPPETIIHSLKNHSTAEFECEWNTHGSQKRFFKWTLIKGVSSDQSATRIYALGQDITSLNNKIKDLKEKELTFQSIVQKAVDGYITIDENGIIQSFNEAAETIFGFSSNDLVGQSLSALMPEPYSKEHKNYINNYLSTGKSNLVNGPAKEFVAKHKDGYCFPVEIAVREIHQGYRRLFVGVVHDIRKRKELEISLSETMEKLKYMMEAESDAVMIMDATKQTILEANNSAFQLFGFSKENLLGLTINDISTDTQNSDPAENGNTANFGQIFKQPLNYYKKKDGTVFPAQTSTVTFPVRDQKIYLKIIRDISNQTQMEGQIRESNDHLQDILNHSNAIIYQKDTEGKYTMVNSQFEALFKVSNEKVIGKTENEVLPETLANKIKQNDQRVLETGSVVQSEESILHNDGMHTYSTIHFPIRNSSGILYSTCSIWTDTTLKNQLKEKVERVQKDMEQLMEKQAIEFKNSQSKIIRQEKLEAANQLANSLSNQINQPIQGIKTLLHQVIELVPMEEIHQGLIRLSINECNRISELVEKIKGFQNLPQDEIKSLNLHQILEKSIEEKNSEIKNQSIELEKKLVKDSPHVQGASYQLQQVISHVLQNALEAISNTNGKILIATEREDSKIKIYIQDNGCGIPPEIKNSIFDPFFTTKGALKQQGLGLTLSSRILKSHRGEIDIKSQPGKGTTVTIILPSVN